MILIRGQIHSLFGAIEIASLPHLVGPIAIVVHLSASQLVGYVIRYRIAMPLATRHSPRCHTCYFCLLLVQELPTTTTVSAVWYVDLKNHFRVASIKDFGVHMSIGFHCTRKRWNVSNCCLLCVCSNE